VVVQAQHQIVPLEQMEITQFLAQLLPLVAAVVGLMLARLNTLLGAAVRAGAVHLIVVPVAQEIRHLFLHLKVTAVVMVRLAHLLMDAAVAAVLMIPERTGQQVWVVMVAMGLFLIFLESQLLMLGAVAVEQIAGQHR